MAARAQVNITDRAKRYRAQNAVTGPEVCVMCGSRSDLQVMHLTGNESHGEKSNLAYGCRSCNGKLSAAFKALNLGRPTNQYNPATGVPTFQQYMWAVSNHTRGEHDAAGAIIHATPKSKRIEYARRIVSKAQATKRERSDERWNPTNPWPFSSRQAPVPASGGIAHHMAKRGSSGAAAGRKRGARGAAADRAEQKKWDLDEKALEKHYAKGGTLAEFLQANPGTKRNPAGKAAEVFESFHGFEPSEVVTVSKKVFRHEHLAAAGDLTHLDVWGIDEQGHHISKFKGAFLAFNEDCNQLFVEGGDQRIDLSDFGIDPPHELETLGRVTDIGYKTDKRHLGDEGGVAVYVHKFRTTNDNGRHVTVRIARYPDLIYDVRNEQLLFSGGSYEILAEGINK